MIDLSCCCAHCESNRAFKNTSCNGINNPSECDSETFAKYCDYRNQPKLKAAYDKGYEDGYDAAY